jgi:D-galactarolactone cycloisomerase
MPTDTGLTPSDSLLPADPALPGTGPIRIRHVQTFVFRAPIAEPVITSFGEMRDRPAVLVRVEDQDGAHGWGEVWCNFPACGAEHRARLVDSVFAPQLIGMRHDGVVHTTRTLESRVRVIALQTAEWGPLAQALAGVDIALWDLSARKAGVPVATLLGAPAERLSLPTYASGINPDGAGDTVQACRRAGFRAFKVKLGFGADRDLATLAEVRGNMAAGDRLMGDANQGWDIDAAIEMSRRAARYDLEWLEEPLAADRPVSEWRRLTEASPVPIAGGENLRGAEAFTRALRARVLDVLQPDMCKWGGFTGCLPVARAVIASGKRYCPHFLGSGLGLMASAHLLAAAGGDGLLEVDANPNPLRDLLMQGVASTGNAGRVHLPRAPGLGVEPDLAEMRGWLTEEHERY